jgi:hypothetical protein
MVSSLTASGSLTLDRTSLQEILKISRGLEVFADLGQDKGNKVIFNYEFKQEGLFVNGAKI